MKINKIETVNFKAGVKISAAENKDCQYLYNKVLKLTYDYKIPANFKTHQIELSVVTEKVLSKLKELGIKFN